MVIEEAQKEHKGPKCQVMPLDVSNLASNFHHSLDDQENPISSFNQDDDIEWFNMLLGLFVHGDNFAKVDTSWFDTLSEEDILLKATKSKELSDVVDYEDYACIYGAQSID